MSLHGLIAMRCTGACCREIYLSHTRDEIRRKSDVDGDSEAALLLVLMRPVVGFKVECVALTTTGCALDREARPRMCTTYPYGGDRCRSCGAGSDAEARGVALQRA